MLIHYIKFAFRNFRSNKIIFIGTLLTLSIGALCVSLLSSYIYNEFTMNNFHENEENIFITVQKSSPLSEWAAISPSLFYNVNYNTYPEIDIHTSVIKYESGEIGLANTLTTFYPEGVVVDSSFFKVFDFDLSIGDTSTVLKQPDAILLSEKLANKIFGNKNPIGEKIQINTSMTSEYIVKGIFKALPANSSIVFDFIIRDSHVPNQFARIPVDFLLTNTSFDKNIFNLKIRDLKKPSILEVKSFESTYFNEDGTSFRSVFSKYGNKTTLYVLIVILIVILVISIMNISNLQIINTSTNVKFMALNVINGAKKKHLIHQKLTELGLLGLFTAIIITIAYQLVLPVFNNFTGVPLSFPLLKLLVLNGFIVISFILLAFIYPLVSFSNIPIISGLKNQAFLNRFMGKKNVIIAQFALTFILLISSVIVSKQLDVLLQKDLGFTSENIIRTTLFREIPVPVYLFGYTDAYKKTDPSIIKDGIAKEQMKREQQLAKYKLIKNELNAHSTIHSFSRGGTPLANYSIDWKLKGSNDDYINHKIITINPEHEKTFDFKIIEGRFFDAEKDKSRGNKIVINEAAKKYWGIDNISENRILSESWGDDKGNGYEIIGVVQDFNFEHLSSKPKPLVMVYFDDLEDDFFIRFEENAMADGLKYVEGLFKEINPNETFTYSFLSDEIKQLYDKEKQLSIIYIIFAALALFISAIGLFTIALYDTNRRIKEIGVRKVNGAKTHEVLLMLNKDFSKYVIIAFIIACPIAYLLMYRWLQGFAYKTHMSWWIFIASGVLVLIIALLTVSWQSYRAATTNPVKSLRAE